MKKKKRLLKITMNRIASCFDGIIGSIYIFRSSICKICYKNRAKVTAFVIFRGKGKKKLNFTQKFLFPK